MGGAPPPGPHQQPPGPHPPMQGAPAPVSITSQSNS